VRGDRQWSSHRVIHVSEVISRIADVCRAH
jgi:hypothetical protein